MPARFAAFLLFLCWSGLAAAGDFLELRAGEFTINPSATPPAADAGWQPQTLPDIWLNTHATGTESGWYRFRFAPPPHQPGIPAVYLPKLGLNAEVWLNGLRIGSGGRMQEPLSRNWNRSLLFPIPPDALRQGSNVLYVHLRGNAYTQASLFPLYVGPEHLLRQAHERTVFFNIMLNQSATVLIAAIGLLMLSLWWRRKKEIAYGYFGVSALVWAIQSINLYVRDIPFSTAQWETLTNSSFQIFAALLLASLLRFIGVWKAIYRPWFLSLLIAAPLSLALIPAPYFLGATAFWHLATLAATVFTLALTLRAAIAGNREARLLVWALLLIVVFAMHDWALHSAHLWRSYAGEVPGGDINLLQYSAPLLFLALGWIMTSRYLRTLDEFERLNNELDQRVREREAELEASYARMKQLETEQAVAAERERIHGDLHDDVGAKLLSLVYRAENSENAELARSALQDLRDVVSQSSESIGLEELAADWRAECEKRLTEAHIRLRWEESGNLSNARMSQPQALNLTRILREAVSNIIRHSQAVNASVQLDLDAQELQLNISDDGMGCPESATTGRGLRNMHARAQRLRGELTRRRPQAGGCVVELRMPLET